MLIALFVFSLNAKAQNNRYYIDNTEVKPEELSALAGVSFGNIEVTDSSNLTCYKLYTKRYCLTNGMYSQESSEEPERLTRRLVDSLTYISKYNKRKQKPRKQIYLL